MTCESLSLQVLTVHGKQSIVENFQKLVADVPIDCIEAIYSGLSSALAVTTEAMRKIYQLGSYGAYAAAPDGLAATEARIANELLTTTSKSGEDATGGGNLEASRILEDS